MEHEVFIPVPAETLREALRDHARVARCVPGLQQDADESARPLSGRLKVRVGGHTITYRGALTLTERAGGFTAKGEGAEVRGTGSAKLNVRVRLTETAGGTTVTFTATSTSDGRLSEIDPSTSESTGRRLLDRFASALRKGDASAASGGAPGPDADQDATRADDAGVGRAEDAPAPGDARAASGEAGSLDAGRDRDVAAAGDASRGESGGGEGPTGAGQPAEGSGADGAGAGGPDEDATASGADAAGGRDADVAASGDGSGDRSGGGRPAEGLGGEQGESDPGVNASGGDEDELDDPDSFDDSLGFGDTSSGDGDFLVPIDPPAEAAHARRTMIGRSAEEVDHAPPRGRYAPEQAPESGGAGAALRWVGPAAALAIAGAVVVGRALRRRR